jgi:hypothetical protein
LERRWWLCIAPAAACVLDAGLTLAYQPADYWAGRFGAVNEVSPIDRWMLLRHPLAFVAWVATWITAFSFAIRYLPTRAGMAVALTLILGNVSGAYSWVSWRVPAGFWVGDGIDLLIAGLVVVTWAKAGVLASGRAGAEPSAAAYPAAGGGSMVDVAERPGR